MARRECKTVDKLTALSRQPVSNDILRVISAEFAKVFRMTTRFPRPDSTPRVFSQPWAIHLSSHGGEIHHERGRSEIVSRAFFGLRACNHHGALKLDRAGFNAIRVPLHYSLFESDDSEGFRLVDRMIVWSRAEHLLRGP